MTSESFTIKDVNCNFLLQPRTRPGPAGDPRTFQPARGISRLTRGITYVKPHDLRNPIPGIVVGYYSTGTPRMTNPADYAQYQAVQRASFEMFNFVYKVWMPCIKAELTKEDFEDANKKRFLKKVAAMADVTVSVAANDIQGAIPPGTLVDVSFSCLDTLANPQIVKVKNKIFDISSVFPNPPGRPFSLGSPYGSVGTLGTAGVSPGSGDFPGVERLPGQPPEAGSEDSYPYKMSEKARKKKRGAEGARLALYNDPYGYCTIGIGHLVGGLKSCAELETAGKIPAKWLKGDVPPDGKNKHGAIPTITAAEAEALFIQDIEKREKRLVRLLKDTNNVKVTQNQFDALMSAVYNAGTSNVKKYIVVPHLAQATPDFKGAAEAFTVYGRMGYFPAGHDQYLPGLKRLREKERALFYKA